MLSYSMEGITQQEDLIQLADSENQLKQNGVESDMVSQFRFPGVNLL